MATPASSARQRLGDAARSFRTGRQRPPTTRRGPLQRVRFYGT